jgi:hypothetical protein
MTSFGVTSAGFVAKTQQDILADIEAAQIATIAPTLDVSADTPLGQLNGIYTNELAQLWELVSVAFGAFDPDDAEDFLLTALCKLSGTQRQAATYSTVDLVVNLDNAATIVSGTHYASIAGNPDSRWTPLADYTSPGNGLHTVRFRAESVGKRLANSGTITVIATPVVGWNTVINPLDASGGTEADDDAALRTRRDDDLAASGSSTLDALVADLERASGDGGTIVGLQPGTMAFENTGSVTDGFGRPPHSFEIILYDGVTPDPGNNNAIAQVIWDSKAGGIRSYGNSSGVATDANGDAHVVYFSRVAIRPVYLSYLLSVDPSYDGTNADEELKQAIAEAANARFTTPGGSITALTLQAMPLSHEGVIDVPTMTLGFDPFPTVHFNLVLGATEIGRFDTSRILIFR